MKSIVFSAMFAVLLVCVLSTPTFGQNVYLLDVGKIFKNHARFNAEMDRMKKEVELFRKQVQRDQTSIQQQAEKLKTMNPETREYKTFQTQLAKASAEIQVEHQLKNKEFMEREAKLYLETYVDVSNRVAAFCDANKIQMILRYNSEDSKSTDRQSVMQKVNNSIVYQSGRNVTDYIIQQVAAPTNKARSAQQPAGTGQRR